MNATASARLRGRPPARALLNQRERLLDAARDAFAQAGLEGSPLAQIARRANVTPALAHYYFANKSELFEAVLQERVTPALSELCAAVEARREDPAAALAYFVQQYTVLAARSPWLPRITLREPRAGRSMHQLMQLLLSLVHSAQQRGALRADLHAGHIALSVLSLCAFAHVISDASPASLAVGIDPATVPQLTLHHLALLRDGLRGPGPPASRR